MSARITTRLLDAVALPIADTDRADAEWIEIGEVVANRYQIRRLLGIGGMGLVVEALDTTENQVVALKFLRPSLCLSGEIQKRFRREMRTLSKLSSEYALHVFEAGSHRGVPFIVTEFLQGESVAERLGREGVRSVAEAVGWILQACEALAEAHRLGIVHRDLKPENLFLQRRKDGRETLKVLDFGISKTPCERNSDPELVTRTHVVMGSPYYMPPEQLAASKNVDHRSDIWALGVSLFELLTNELPFDGASVSEVGRKILLARPSSARELRPELPAALDAAIQRCLQSERLHRFQSVAELARELEPFAPPEYQGVVARICETLGVELGRGDQAPASSYDAGPVQATGSLRNNRYRTLVQLGEGGTAKVTLAVTQGRYSKLVVLKTLLHSLASEVEFVRMFASEAKLSSRLNHPNVIQVNDVFSDNGLPTLVLEYLEGQPLSAILTGASTELPLELHLWILCEVLAGLHYAHELRDYDGSALNLVHRDVSPQNVFVSYDGQVKVLDFGIAKADGLVGHTRTGVVKGKVRYMAPEQIRGASDLDRRVDVFAVGVMLWEAITKQRLWGRTSEAQVMKRVVCGDIPRPSEAAPGCPPELESICMKALAHDAQQRYQTAAELRAALEDFLNQRTNSLAASGAAAFMNKHFGAERRRMHQRVQQLLSGMPDVRAMQSNRRFLRRPRGASARRRILRSVNKKLSNISPLTTLVCGAVLASFITWAGMSSRKAVEPAMASATVTAHAIAVSPAARAKAAAPSPGPETRAASSAAVSRPGAAPTAVSGRPASPK